MGLKMLAVLLACVWLAAGSPIPPSLNGITRGSYIRHCGAAWYDTASLREHHARKRRDASEGDEKSTTTERPLVLRLHALDRSVSLPNSNVNSRVHTITRHAGNLLLNKQDVTSSQAFKTVPILPPAQSRFIVSPIIMGYMLTGYACRLTMTKSGIRVFKMRLVRDVGLFATDAEFEGSKGRSIAFNSLHAYTGTLEDDETALVHGVVTSDGLFDGTVSTDSEEIYIEPASRYFRTRRSESPDVDASPIYHTIAYRSTDVARPRQEHSCDSERLRPNGSLKFNHTFRKNEAPYQPNTSQPIYQHLNDGKSHAKPGFYPKDARRKNPTASSHNLELLDKLYRERYTRVLRKRTSVDPKKTTCMLYLQADHTFFNHYKSEEACIEVMTRHVQRVNAIYRYTDFNQDGQPDNISFMIKRVKVHGHDALQDPTYRYTGSYGVEEFLELFSEEDYDAFCLSYMFTYRDFEKGTLGLAWTGDLKNAGGVCEKNGHYRGSMKSLNTGIITLLNYGKHVPPAVSHVTLAHEIGHNFGSPHDPDECSPGGEDGNFIMFARATSGDKRNNNRFSPCSLLSINPVLNTKARSAKGCFAEPQSALCGNGVVEEGEECDCGWEEDCNDPCCHPQRRHHPPHEIPCRLTEGSVCSPSQGPCCTSGCTLRSGDKCRDDNGCRDASFCDGRGPQCPQSINKPNKTICNEEFVCYMGECTGSICLAYGLESCQCIANPDDPPTKSCELCCKMPGENQPCLSSFAWNSPPYDIPDMFSKPGTPCNDYNGYCDIFQKCREVDPSGPLATLRRLLLSDASLATFQRWITDHWYAVGILALAVLIALVAVAQLFGRRAGSRMNKLSGLTGVTSGTGENTSDGKQGSEKGTQAIPSTTPKIGPINVARIKKRIIETMKTITSPRRSKTPQLKSDFHIPKLLNFVSRMDAKDIQQKTEQTERDLTKILENVQEDDRGNDQRLSYGVEKNDGTVISKEKSKAIFTDRPKVTNYLSVSTAPKDRTTTALKIVDQKTSNTVDRKKRSKMTLLNQNEFKSDCQEKGIGNWLFGLGFGGRTFCKDKAGKVSRKYSWNFNSNLRNIEKLRGPSKPLTSSQTRLRENNQSEEPLVEPETPETPESPAEVTASRVATSDLVVLLQES